MGEFDKLVSGLLVKKLPPLSPGAKDSAVKLLPWLFICFGALGLFAVLSAVVSFSFSSMMAMGMGQVMGMSIPALGFVMIYVLTPLIQVFSIAGGYCMLKHEFRGWQLAVIATFLSLLAHVLYLSIVGILFDVLFLYILYQIKERYVI